MSNSIAKGLSPRGLRVTLVLFLIGISIPSGLLLYRAYDQMKWEVFHQYRIIAEDTARRIDADLKRLIDAEEARSFNDYAFLTINSGSNAQQLQSSPLSQFPVSSDLPGLIGYFQVDSEGRFSSPLVPAQTTDYGEFGISQPDYEGRLKLHRRLESILSIQQRIGGRKDAPANTPTSDADPVRELALANPSVGKVFSKSVASNVFDRLANSYDGEARERSQTESAELDELELDSRLEQKSRDQEKRLGQKYNARFGAKRATRKEQVAVYDLAPAPAAAASAPAESVTAMPNLDNFDDKTLRLGAALKPTLRFFESEIDPFSFEVLDDEHFVMFRNVWRDGARFIQGAVIARGVFLEQVVVGQFRRSALDDMSELLVAFDGNFIVTSSRDASIARSADQGLAGELLYRMRLSSPLAALDLIFTVVSLPLYPSMQYLAWVALVLAIVLLGGCFVIYRFGLQQIALFHQQQDFVSAVSHELKTPLTSIRMYAEMLKSGWASDEKKSTYYHYIHEESERLSRLIANVLQLSRMTHGKHPIDIKRLGVAELLDIVQSKVSSQAQAANFALRTDFAADALACDLLVDADAFVQIVINLIDNAIKFTPADAQRQIDLSCKLMRNGSLNFSVRDYGNGIPKGQMLKIFQLFYRSESELTRETVGTGIGLALVHQLTSAMSGKVDVSNVDPGAEFSVSFSPAGH